MTQTPCRFTRRRADPGEYTGLFYGNTGLFAEIQSSFVARNMSCRFARRQSAGPAGRELVALHSCAGFLEAAQVLCAVVCVCVREMISAPGVVYVTLEQSPQHHPLELENAAMRRTHDIPASCGRPRHQSLLPISVSKTRSSHCFFSTSDNEAGCTRSRFRLSFLDLMLGSVARE